MSDDVPHWLLVMRSLTGTTEVPASGDNPKILGMADAVAQIYPEMESYCDQYQHDATPWCGLTAAYCMAESEIRPPFGPADTDKFLWALSWADDPNFSKINSPIPGAVVVMKRAGGGHVTFYESTDGSNYRCRGGNQSDSVNLSTYPIANVIQLVWPKGQPMPSASRREIEEGDEGPDVVEVQRLLGIPLNGDFGPVTKAAVQGFQAACALEASGVVGSDTWDKLDEFAAKVKAGDVGLSDELIEDIMEIAKHSAISGYDWKDRGQAPPGHMVGIALCFGLAVKWYNDGNSAALAMGEANTYIPTRMYCRGTKLSSRPRQWITLNRGSTL